MKRFEDVFTLRQYQVEAVNGVLDLVNQGARSVIVQQDTGTGKTVEIYALIARFLAEGKRCLLIAPKTDIIDNLLVYANVLDLSPGTFYNEGNNRFLAPLVIGTLDTLRNRVPGWLHQGLSFDYVFWDEGHHLKAKTWEATFTALSRSIHLLFTATPARLDGKGFDGMIEKMLCVKTTSWFFENGQEVNGVWLPYLSPYRVLATPHTQGDFRVTRGEYDTSQQDRHYSDRKIAGDVVKEYFTHCEGESMFGFAPSVQVSKDLTARYNAEYGYEAVIHLDADTPKDYRREVFQRLKTGNIIGVYNVDLLTEGVDAPSVSVCQDVSQTASLSKHRQRCGRVLRPKLGKTATFLCHTDNMHRLGEPNTNYNWTLAGIDRSVSYELKCERCFNPLLEDYREFSKELYMMSEGKQFFTCPKCEHQTLIPQIKTQRRGERKEIEFDDSPLVSFTQGDRIELNIAEWIYAVKKRGYKPMWAIYRMLETPNFTLKNCQKLCEGIGYRTTAARYLIKGYDLIWYDRGLSRDSFCKKLLNLGVAQGLHSSYWQIYQKIDKLSRGKVEV
jgi:superfamily II DNA or RNA helicase